MVVAFKITIWKNCTHFTLKNKMKEMKYVYKIWNNSLDIKCNKVNSSIQRRTEENYQRISSPPKFDFLYQFKSLISIKQTHSLKERNETLFLIYIYN